MARDVERERRSIRRHMGECTRQIRNSARFLQSGTIPGREDRVALEGRMITAWAGKRVSLKQELRLLDFADWEDANLAKVAELRRELDRLREESAAEERCHEERRQRAAELGARLVSHAANTLLSSANLATQDAILSGLWTLGLSLRTWRQLSAIVGRPVEGLEATFVAADQRHSQRVADEGRREKAPES